MKRVAASETSVIHLSKSVACFTALVALLLVFSMSHEIPIAQSAGSSSTIRGLVVDAVTSQPLKNATMQLSVTIITPTGTRGGSQTTELRQATQTSDNGSFRFSTDAGYPCTVVAYCDDPASPGCDYLPKLQSFTLEKDRDTTLVFRMVPAASIIFGEELMYVDSPKPASTWSFRVILDDVVSDISGSILTYGQAIKQQLSLTNVNSSHVIVPANTSLRISVESSTSVSHSFLIDDQRLSHLGKGEIIRVKTLQYSLPHNLNYTEASIGSAGALIAEAEQKGFYVIVLERDLSKASALVEEAQRMLSEGSYEGAYTDLRDAYTKAAIISDSIRQMFTSASASAPLIIIFLALTSTVLSYLLLENWAKKIISAGAIYATAVTAFYYMYAGSRILDPRQFVAVAAASITFSSLVAFVIPNQFPMTVMFSLAKRNIRRRATRFVLTLIPITVLVFSFVALTSFSAEYGFTIQAAGPAVKGQEGLLIRQRRPAIPSLAMEQPRIVASFTPLDSSTTDWLRGKTGIAIAAPKAENYPTRVPLGSLFSSTGKSLTLFGVMAIVPSAEARATGFDTLLVPGEGRYLADDEDGAMISTAAAKTMNVSVGENLTLRVGASAVNVTLVGLLDDDQAREFKDFDGTSIMPEKLIITIVDQVVTKAEIDPCDPSEVVVINWHLSSKMPAKILFSRIDAVPVDSSVDLLAFARQLSLERDYLVWASAGGSICLLGIVPYLEAQGVSILIPWLIVVLNVVIVMVNAIYERRNEVMILSSLGLNPTGVTILFTAEALIIGVIGGGLGYLFGLGSYRVMALFPTDIMVRQKVSFEWCLASLGISVTAVLVGAFVALKSSVAITPSLLRRWTIEQKAESLGEGYQFEIPIRLRADEVDALFDYLRRRVEGHVQMVFSTSPDSLKKMAKESEDKTDDTDTKKISFMYRLGRGDPIGMFPFQLSAEHKKSEETYRLRVIARPGEPGAFDRLVVFIRLSVVDWTARTR